MRLIITCFLSLLLFSCSSNNQQTEQLNQRITSLEQKVDSLISLGNTRSVGLNNNSSATTVNSLGPVYGRCQALTKKGSQCKRKSKNNGYCWQHGG